MKQSIKTEHPIEIVQADKECSELDVLRKRLEEKEKQAMETFDRLLRTASDFENYKKKIARENESLIRFANEELIRDILPFIDNLERTLEHSEKTKDSGSLLAGVRLTCDQVLRTLREYGLSPVQSLGGPFDPAVHEAMMTVETNEVDANQVVEEFTRGYLLHDRLIRAAKVSVSTPSHKEG